MNLFPNLRLGSATGPDDDAEEARRKAGYEAGRLGPRRFTSPTNGQLRRAAQRRSAAEKRKANRRYRRQWIAAQHAFAGLHGQVMVALGIVDATPALKRNVTLELIRTYGSLEAAIKFHDELAAERSA